MFRKIALAAPLLLVAGATAASADHDRVKSIDTDQWKQNRQIEDGRYNGSLTRREYRELLAEQERIKRMEAAALADGHISRREYRDIREAQAEAGRHIQAEESDGQISFWRRWLYRSRY
jgi:uncharacterized membrane protein YebE (DUF533 family)